VLLGTQSRGIQMCAECDELDRRLARYRTLALRNGDQATIDGLAGLVEQYQARKRALHLEREKPAKPDAGGSR
jgi:hypothetical protein